MYLGKASIFMLLSFISILYVASDAYGTLNFQIDPTGGGTINITSCSRVHL